MAPNGFKVMVQENNSRHSNLVQTLCDECRLVTTCVGSLTEVKSRMFTDISRMAFLVTSVSMFNNFIPIFANPGTFTFANIIVLNCLSRRNSYIK